MTSARLDIGADGGAIQAVFETINSLLIGQEELFARVGGASEAAARAATNGFDAARKGAEQAAEAVEAINEGLDNVERGATAASGAFSLLAGGPVAALKSVGGAIADLHSQYIKFQNDSMQLWAENANAVRAWERALESAAFDLEQIASIQAFNEGFSRQAGRSFFEIQGVQTALAPVFTDDQKGLQDATTLVYDVAAATNQSLEKVASALADFQRTGETSDSLLGLGIQGFELDRFSEITDLQEKLPDLEKKYDEFRLRGVKGAEDLGKLSELTAELAKARAVAGVDVRDEIYDRLRSRSFGAAEENRDPFGAFDAQFEQFQFNFGKGLVEASLPLAEAQGEALLRINDALEAGSSFGDVLAELPGAIQDVFADSPLRDQLGEFLRALRDIFLSVVDALAEVAVEGARVIGVQVEDAIVKGVRGFAVALGIDGAADVESRLEANQRQLNDAATPAFRLIGAAARGGDEQAAEALERIAAARADGGFEAAQVETINSINRLRREDPRFANVRGNFALPEDIARFDTSGAARALGRGLEAAGRLGPSVEGIQFAIPEFGAQVFEEASRRTGGAAGDSAEIQGAALSGIYGEFRRYTQLFAQQAHAPREATL